MEEEEEEDLGQEEAMTVAMAQGFVIRDIRIAMDMETTILGATTAMTATVMAATVARRSPAGATGGSKGWMRWTAAHDRELLRLPDA